MSEDKKHLIDNIIALLEEEDTKSLEAFLNLQRSSDIAEVIEYLGSEDSCNVFRLLDVSTAAEVIEKVDEATRSSLFEVLEDEELKDIILELDPDDAADILAELPEEDSLEFLKQMPAENSEEIKNLMRYTEDSAGGIMDPVLVSVPVDATVAEAIHEIQEQEIDEDFFAIYVVDKNGRFLGDVRLRSLLVSKPDRKIDDLINPDAYYVSVDADQEEVRNFFSKNDLIVVPVLDLNGKLVGRITADRIIEVAEEEAAEDIYAMAGTDAYELEKTSVFHAARIRMTWLLPCLLGTGVTAMVMLIFKNIFIKQGVLATYMVVASFVPMIAAISGNAGLQTSAIVVCGLATGHLAARRLSQVFMREARVALIVAICCGLVGGLICASLQKGLELNGNNQLTGIDISLSQILHIVTAFSLAMFLSIMVATTLGLFLPFFFKKVGIDPAISSGPLVTTANDSISVTIYLALTLTFLVLF